MTEEAKRILKQTPLYTLYNAYRANRIYSEWLKKNDSSPPPHIAKQKTVREYARRYGLSVLVETGTHLGNMVDAMKTDFAEIYSIELDKNLYISAVNRFSHYKHISILQGDSGDVLPDIVCKATQPCLFWLDGHYSQGITAKGESETPIRKELECILRSSIRNHVILIDDARLFVGENDYPSINELREYLLKERSDLAFEVINDIIRIYPEI